MKCGGWFTCWATSCFFILHSVGGSSYLSTLPFRVYSRFPLFSLASVVGGATCPPRKLCTLIGALYGQGQCCCQNSVKPQWHEPASLPKAFRHSVSDAPLLVQLHHKRIQMSIGSASDKTVSLLEGEPTVSHRQKDPPHAFTEGKRGAHAEHQHCAARAFSAIFAVTCSTRIPCSNILLLFTETQFPHPAHNAARIQTGSEGQNHGGAWKGQFNGSTS